MGSTFAFYVKARRSSASPKDAGDPLNAAQIRRGSLAKNSRPTTPNQSAVDLANSVTTTPLTTTTDVAKSPLKVLIVEDNLVNQKVLAKQLQKMGCLIYLANHGGEAIERLMSSRFWRGKEGSGIELDVILMDLEMPVMDGLTCTRRIRQLQLSESLAKHVPVIAVTANAREEQIATAREAGVVSGISTLLRINADYPSGRCRVQTIPHTRTTSEDENACRSKYAKDRGLKVTLPQFPWVSDMICKRKTAKVHQVGPMLERN